MGDHAKTQETDSVSNVKDSSESNTSDVEDVSKGLIVDCKNVNCTDPKNSNILAANSEIINLIVADYWRGLSNRQSTVEKNHKLDIEFVKKRIGHFTGDELEKHAALHKLCAKLALCYYVELGQELKEIFRDICSSKSLEESYDIHLILSKTFEEVDCFNSPESFAIWLEEKDHVHESLQNILIERIASLTKTEKSWLEKVSKQQYEYFEAFTLMRTDKNECTWIELENDDDCLLELIGFTIYKTTHPIDQYSKKELNKIKLIAKQICSQSDCNIVSLSCIFIIYMLGTNEVHEPIFKVKNDSRVLFVDINQRVYKNWNDFMTTNKLPACLYCFPIRGEYNKKKGLNVDFARSPESSPKKKMMNVFDLVGKVITVGSTAALGAAAVLPTLPIVAVGGTVAAVASGAYGVKRGISKIVDKVNHVQDVKTQDVVNVFSNALSVATGGVAKVVPALTTLGRSVLITQSAVQGLTAITTLVPEENNNIAPQSGELPMKTLLFFNSKSPHEAVENIKEAYDMTSDKSTVLVIKTFVAANSVMSASMGEIKKYFSKSLTLLVLNLIEAVEGKNAVNSLNVLFLRDLLNNSGFTSLVRAFAGASEQQQAEFFRLLMDSVYQISSSCATSVPLKSFGGVEFHSVSEVFEQIDFAINANGGFYIEKLLDCVTRKKLQTYITKILAIICDDGNCFLSLNDYTNLIQTKWPDILSAFKKPPNRKKVRFESQLVKA